MKASRTSVGRDLPEAVIRFRHVVAIMAFIGIGVAAPLIVVWKEAYLTRLSLEQKASADTLATLRREAERLRLTAQGLSQVARIEEIARRSLGLEYPTSHQIVIVPASTGARRSSGVRWEFFAILRRSLSKDKG